MKQAAQQTITLINAETGLGRIENMVLGKCIKFQFLDNVCKNLLV
jgi:hypothetical protein